MSIRNFIDKIAGSDDLVTIDQQVDTTFELANVAHALEGKLVLFNDIKDFPGWRICSGLCAERKFFGLDLGVTVGGLIHHLAQSLANPVPPPMWPPARK